MTYATRDDLTERYGADEVGQRESALPPGATDRALADAAAAIDGYLAARYLTPLSPVPATIARLACDIAWYFLLGPAAGEHEATRYKDAVNTLRDIAAGRYVIDVPAAGPVTTSATVEIVTGDRVFARGGS